MVGASRVGGRVLAALLALHVLLLGLAPAAAVAAEPILLDAIAFLKPGQYAVVQLTASCVCWGQCPLCYCHTDKQAVMEAGPFKIFFSTDEFTIWNKDKVVFKEDLAGKMKCGVDHYRTVTIYFEEGLVTLVYNDKRFFAPYQGDTLTIVGNTGKGEVRLLRTGKIGEETATPTQTPTATATATPTATAKGQDGGKGVELVFKDARHDRLLLVAGLAIVAVAVVAVAFRGGAGAAALLLLMLAVAAAAPAAAANVVVLGAGGVGEHKVIRLERGKKYYIYFEVEYEYTNNHYDIARLAVVDSSGQVLAASFSKGPSETIDQAIGATIGLFSSAIAAVIGLNPNYDSLVSAAQRLISAINCLDQIGVVTLSSAQTMCITLGKYLEEKRGRLVGALEIICGVDGKCYVLTGEGKRRIGSVLHVYMSPGKSRSGEPLKVYVRIDTGVKMSLVLLLAAVAAVAAVGVVLASLYLGRGGRARSTTQQLAVLGLVLIVVGLALGVLAFRVGAGGGTVTVFSAEPATVTVTTTATWTETVTMAPVFEKEYTVSVPECDWGRPFLIVDVREGEGGQLVASAYGECTSRWVMSTGNNPLALLCTWANGESLGCSYVYTLPYTAYIPMDPGTYRVKVRLYDLR